jgi:hypothetical protein
VRADKADMQLKTFLYVSSLMCIHSLNFQINLPDGLDWARDSSDRTDRVNKIDGDVALAMKLLRIRYRIGRVLRLDGGAPLLKMGGAGISSNASTTKHKAKPAKKKSITTGTSAVSDEEEEEEGHWKPMCRICYEVDPAGLFVPCKCTGSMGFVHRLHRIVSTQPLARHLIFIRLYTRRGVRRNFMSRRLKCAVLDPLIPGDECAAPHSEDRPASNCA